MFGYVRPLQDELKVRDMRHWREDYCGLCRCLGKRHGFFSRFLLSYDLTFLYGLMTMNLPPDKAEKCWCPARIVCRKSCRPWNEAMEFAADVTILLSWWKIQDERKDGDILHRIGADILSLVYRRAYKKAAESRPEQDALIRLQIEKLDQLELQCSDSIDQTADAFAQILKSCAAWWQNATERRAAEQVLYHVGRYIYLVDALDDLQEDWRANAYNPLRFRFEIKNGVLQPEDQQYFLQTINRSIDFAAAAFELMERKRHSSVTENIIYYGLPAVLKAVAEGCFEYKKKQVKL